MNAVLPRYHRTPGYPTIEITSRGRKTRLYGVYQTYPDTGETFLCMDGRGRPHLYRDMRKAHDAAREMRNLRDENLDHLGDQTRYDIDVCVTIAERHYQMSRG